MITTNPAPKRTVIWLTEAVPGRTIAPFPVKGFPRSLYFVQRDGVPARGFRSFEIPSEIRSIPRGREIPPVSQEEGFPGTDVKARPHLKAAQITCGVCGATGAKTNRACDRKPRAGHSDLLFCGIEPVRCFSTMASRYSATNGSCAA